MNVGDYVRTNLKNEIVICKVIDIIHSTSMNDNRMKFDKPTKFSYYVEDNKNYKSSPNIIDLLEVGDLVKIEFYSPRYEERLQRLFEVEYKDEDWIRFNNAHCDLSIFHNQWGGNDKELNPIIKSIITHQQIENMEYKVKE